MSAFCYHSHKEPMHVDDCGKKLTWRLPAIGEDKHAEDSGMSEDEDGCKGSDMRDLDENIGIKKSGNNLAFDRNTYKILELMKIHVIEFFNPYGYALSLQEGNAFFCEWFCHEKSKQLVVFSLRLTACLISTAVSLVLSVSQAIDCTSFIQKAKKGRVFCGTLYENAYLQNSNLNA